MGTAPLAEKRGVVSTQKDEKRRREEFHHKDTKNTKKH
jgi:hypothetical protein